MKQPHKMTMKEPPGVYLEDALVCVGPGWAPLIKEVYLEMINYPGVYLTQVKEKFGRLRIYWDDPDIQKGEGKQLLPFCDLISVTEKKSGTICELCGKDGKVIDENGWLQARCPDHAGHGI